MKQEIGKLYRHYKGGKYTVIAYGRLESDPECECVVYRSEHDSKDFKKGTVWVRPRESFEEEIMREDGTVVKRFTEVGCLTVRE